ncbi:hypothetical protein UFOVP1492_77 [uncultured Caudovirales phage]|uniref:Uncharacterized protein n=1 Tax=uncultured Caudovirales phage TaxID=2100421 RepID=A0A6J5RF10_9CAUD|nr:hypothetical protein UFOVP1127_57 [uncultured Caudovirales phage]CAB4193066.1 hypothetical protein UFOVP1242_17 [uncultured Caudovirales phage]CAB4217741.1 hypothetical protein UFOVP1492_77 [uncultured Caudovirales phage]CAB5231561.1 hypothetical protein UFOVP1580_106 [uncultured Caudovirales phage]
MRRSSLIEVLIELGIPSPELLATKILTQAGSRQIKALYAMKTTVKKAAGIERLGSAEEKWCGMFNSLVTSIRQTQRGTKVRPIQKKDAEYLLLKDATAMALEFADQFQLSENEGLRQFVTIGIRLMERRFAWNKWNYYKLKIHSEFEADQVVRNDDKYGNTATLEKIYLEKVGQYAAGIPITIKSSERQHLVYARQDADEAGAKYHDWVEAQFEQLSFLNSVPSVTQLHGANALLRYEKYMIGKGAKQAPVAEDDEDTRLYKEYLAELPDKG